MLILIFARIIHFYGAIVGYPMQVMNKLLRVVRLSSWGIFLASLLTCYVRWPQPNTQPIAYFITQHLDRNLFFYASLIVFSLLQLLFYLLIVRYPKTNPRAARIRNLMNGFVISVNMSIALLMWNLSYHLSLTFSFLYLFGLGMGLLGMSVCGCYFIYLSLVYSLHNSAS